MLIHTSDNLHNMIYTAECGFSYKSLKINIMIRKGNCRGILWWSDVNNMQLYPYISRITYRLTSVRSNLFDDNIIILFKSAFFNLQPSKTHQYKYKHRMILSTTKIQIVYHFHIGVSSYKFYCRKIEKIALLISNIFRIDTRW